MKNTHALERISPKGENFVGKCWKCGMTGLKTPFDSECANLLGTTQEQDMIKAIEGPTNVFD